VPTPVTLYSFYDPSPWDSPPPPAPASPSPAAGAPPASAPTAASAAGKAAAAAAPGVDPLALLCHQSLGRLHLALELVRRGQE
jgi:hypothetical protein